MTIIEYDGVRPFIGKDCFVAESAVVAGRATIEEKTSVWFGATIRAELDSVRIGKRSNIQDNCVVHTDRGFPCEIGDSVSIGHGAIIHGAKIGSNCLIGMGAILLNGSKIGNNSIVGAGALVIQGAEFPENSLILGSPANVKRNLSDEEIKEIMVNAEHYDSFRAQYLAYHENQ
ncbi:MAG: gamma carbonic anhydrase family protein [Thaumarchaeota archaeon]|nr:gamma carbonic anhydrase family protein [Nitrososphaerota archaeon]